VAKINKHINPLRNPPMALAIIAFLKLLLWLVSNSQSIGVGRKTMPTPKFYIFGNSREPIQNLHFLPSPHSVLFLTSLLVFTCAAAMLFIFIPKRSVLLFLGRFLKGLYL